MKLLIILALISSVYCGIRNNITVVNNNTVYLAHTHNCAIYKIDIGTRQQEIVIGDINANYFGDRDAFLGTDALIKNPTSIITDYNQEVLFFVDDSSNIKKADIIVKSIKGVETGVIQDNISNPESIYEGSSYNFAASSANNKIYFVIPTDIFSIDFDINSNSAISSGSTLPNGAKFIDIAFYDQYLYYCYSNADEYFIKKRVDNMFNTVDDDEITINNKPSNITGFTFSSNLLVIAGDSKLYVYSSNAIDTYTSNYNITPADKYTVLCDYKAVYDEEPNIDNYIIARATDSQFHKINITNINLNSINVINLDIKELTIAVNSTDRAIKSYNINTDYLYNSKYDENVMIYLNQNQSNLKVIKYEPSKFRTTKLNLNSNLNIKNITINNTNILFLATDNDIYYCNNITEDREQYNLCNLNISFTGNIISLNYVDNNTNKSLHFMTDQHYYKYTIKDSDNNIITANGNLEEENSNLKKQERIKQTNDTDNLENINDFVIDTNYEIGYIAFEKRLKWFYV
jgi:hypothetical protein